MSSLPSVQSLSSPAPAPSGRRPGVVSEASGVFCFSIQAAAEPGVMPRVLEVFAKRNLVPQRWVSGVDGQGELSIDVQVAGVTPDLGAYMARCLTQLAYVRLVLTSEKARA